MSVKIRKISETKFEIDGVVREFSPPTQRVKHFDQDPAKREVHSLTKTLLEEVILAGMAPSNVRVFHLPGEDARDTQVVYLASGLDPKNLVGIEREESIRKSIEALGLGIPLIFDHLETYVHDNASTGQRVSYDVVSLDFSGPISSNLVHTIRDFTAILENDRVLIHTANLLWREQGYSGYSVGHALHERLSGSPPGSIKDPYSLIAALREMEFDYENKLDQDSKTYYYPYVILNALTTRPVEEYLTVGKFAYGSRFGQAESAFAERAREALGRGPKKLNLVQLVKSHNGSNTQFFADFHRRVTFALNNQLIGAGIYDASSSIVLSALLDVASDSPRLWPQNLLNYRYTAEEGAPMIGSFFLLTRSHELQDAAIRLAESVGFPGRFRVDSPELFAESYSDYAARLDEAMRIYLRTLAPVTEIESRPKLLLTQAIYDAARRAGMTDDHISQAFRGGTISQIARFSARAPIEIPAEEEVAVIGRAGVIDLLASGERPEEILKNYIIEPEMSLSSIRAFAAHVTRGTYGMRDDLEVARRDAEEKNEKKD